MHSLTVLYHMMRADLLERTRRYGFWITLLFAIFLTYFYVPALDAALYLTLNLGGYRPLYNSAWIGSLVALLMGDFLPLFGFYIVKGAIAQDQITRVGQIIAATPMRKAFYTLGKWLSNTALFAAMIVAMIVAALGLQLLRGEVMQIDLWALASPLVLALLPALAVVAATAILFESIPPLSGGLGNLVYFFLVNPILSLTLDLGGNTIVYPSIYAACARHFADCNPTRQIDLSGGALTSLPTFQFDGVLWTPDLLINRFFLLVVAAGIAALASVFFHRFDPAKEGADWFAPLGAFFKSTWEALRSRLPAPTESEAPLTSWHATSLPAATHGNPLSASLALLRAELRLLFKGVGWWWYVVAAGLIVAPLLMPTQIPIPTGETTSVAINGGLIIFLPLAWIWPILLWSSLGARESRYRMDALTLSSPGPLVRQLPLTWLAGVLVALTLALGVLVRLALDGAWPTLGAVVLGALFPPALALALGVLSGSSKLFEGVYLVLWYLGAVQSLSWFDFMGRFPDAFATGRVWLFAGATLALLATAYAARWRRLHA